MRHDVAAGILEHGSGGGERRFFAEIQESAAAIGQAQRHEAATPDIPGFRVNHSQRIPDGDRGIDGIAALAEDVSPDIGSEVLGGDDHAARGSDGGRVGGVGGGSEKYEKQFFFEKKNQKTFDPWSRCRRHRAPKVKKFFGSFFQKRTAFF
jgi:hypothetical protein